MKKKERYKIKVNIHTGIKQPTSIDAEYGFHSLIRVSEVLCDEVHEKMYQDTGNMMAPRKKSIMLFNTEKP